MSGPEQRIKSIIFSVLEPGKYELILFGSRAVAQNADNSDFDIAIKGRRKLPAALLAELRFKLDESLIPFKVDLVDYHAVGQALKSEIDGKGIKW